MKIYLLEKEKLTFDEFILAQSLQGLVNKDFKKRATLIYLTNDNYSKYLEEDAIKIQVMSVWELLQIFRNVTNDVIIYDTDFRKTELNVATNLGVINKALIANYKLIENMVNFGYNIKDDVRKLQGDEIDIQDKVFKLYYANFSKEGLIHQVCNDNLINPNLRDLAYDKNYLTIYTGEDLKSLKFLRKVLSYLNNGAEIFGWCTNELKFILEISLNGSYLIPSDHALNLSALSKFKIKDIKINQNYQLHQNKNYHYLAFVVSDGDNLQWLLNKFLTGDLFGKRQESQFDYQLTFTIPPLLKDLAPTCYNKLKDQKNLEFISGVSGIGYMNPCSYPSKYLKEFVNKTGRAMANSDLNVITLLDNLKNQAKIQEVIDTYGENENIIGGVYELDPDKYEGGKGKIYFSKNHKPFISVRYSLWGPENKKENVNLAYINEMALKINNLKPDIFKESGYTIINIHPWTLNLASLDLLVSKLESHLKIVSVKELISLVNKNLGR